MTAPTGPGSRRRDEHGAALVELAIFLPLIVLLVAAGAFSAKLMTDHARLTHASQMGTRYATRSVYDASRAGGSRYRPTAAEVEAEVRRVAKVPIASVTVTPDPSTAFPGDEIVVTVTTHVGLGPLGSLANAVSRVVGDGPVFPDGGVDLASTAAMREE